MSTHPTWRVGTVPYINVLPLIWGIERYADRINVIKATPRELAALLHRDEIDVGILPAYEYVTNPKFSCLPGMSIASDGPVRSVRVYSRIPFTDAPSILLDVSSKSSIALFHVLIRETFERSPVLTLSERPLASCATLPENYDGFLVIGDLAMKLDGVFAYSLDLGEEWKRLTGLPFVFALWAHRAGRDMKELGALLWECRKEGLDNLEDVAHYAAETTGLPLDTCRDYFFHAMNYDLEQKKLDSIDLFGKYISRYRL